MNLIVAVDNRWGIGRGGSLLAHLPGDLQYFKQMTSGKVVVMGRKTLESLPGGRGLAKRVNYVLTANPSFEAERCITVHSEEELMAELSGYAPEDVFIIGGESIYRRFYARCDNCYVTRIDADLGADRFMVDLDEDPGFRLAWESDPVEENGYSYRFCRYERIK
ncbi:MAG: dihydrofolate reductase [Mogibacterium sp.]|nr:dihydrofolate reductase [Mogibacterium sp.]